jgi:2-polyprenyl-3-methyl-5-hydroxy-6-metoxy-1,4-benzoquinol methylase
MINISRECYLCKEKGVEIVPAFPWLVICPSCGIVYNPDQSVDLREVANQFYDDANMVHRGKIQNILLSVAKERWQWLQKRIPLRNGRLLEVGCGTGEFLVMARDAGWQIDGVELSEIFRETASQWYRLELHGKELPQDSYPEATFDLIAMLHVFEHIPDPSRFLQHIHDLLKPGGWLFIIVPNLSSWTDSLFGTSSPTLTKRDHFFHYTENTLKRVAEKSNFNVLYVMTLEPAHHFWTSLYGYLSSLSKKNLDKTGIQNTGKGFSRVSQIKSNIPYWIGSVTSIFLYPLRLLINRNGKGHEIYLVCRRHL